MNIVYYSVFLLTLNKLKTAKTVSAADADDLGHGRLSADRGWNGGSDNITAITISRNTRNPRYDVWRERIFFFYYYYL
jgi:hypothetical protein